MDHSKETNVSVSKRGDLYEITVAGADDEKIVRSIVAAIGTTVGASESTILDCKIRTMRSDARATL